jgi:membrane-associated phospholipid phosphatase
LAGVLGRLRQTWIDALLVAGFVGLTFALERGVLLGVDVAVRDWTDAHRPPVLFWTAWILNYLGQGTPLSLLVLLLAAWLGWRRHTVRPLLPVGLAFVLAFFTAAPVKLITDRAAPHLPADVMHRERFHSGGLEYPSGHVVNSIVWYWVLALLASPFLAPAAQWAIRAIPPAIVAVVTTYIGYHWFTDSLAGALLGVFLNRLLRRVDWDSMPLGPFAGRDWAGPSGLRYAHPPRRYAKASAQ